MAKKKSRSSNTSFPSLRKVIIYTCLAAPVFFALFTFFYPNTSIKPEKYYIYVKPYIKVVDLADQLEQEGVITSSITFRLVAWYYEFLPKGGMFEVERNWSNFSLINHLRTATPKDSRPVTISLFRDRNQMLRTISKQIRIPADSLKKYLVKKEFLKSIGDFDTESVYCIFLGGTRRFVEYKSAQKFLRELASKYDQYWNSDRTSKARSAGLDPKTAMVLASIVYSETKLKDEMSIIAGVYINRLNKKIKLQSDPTLVFAHRKFSIRRIFNKHKNIDSPYNTYKYTGLPPGPISTVPEEAIEAVLNYTDHDYIYFCAKGDLSGCHLFAETFEEHKNNATKYHQSLDSLGIN